jgi:predicted transposase/invertase (TIGR01784 family)
LIVFYLYKKENIGLIKEKSSRFFQVISNNRIDMGEFIKLFNKEDAVGAFAELLDDIEFEGFQKGKLEERKELAKKMLQANIRIEQILEITGLSVDELKTLI